MLKTYILLDFSNLAFRCKYVCQGDIDTRASMALHIIFNSIRKVWRKFEADHLVICLDDYSWRNIIYKEYKLHRRVKSKLRTPKEVEEDKYFSEIMHDFLNFLYDKTNVTYLKEKGLEADDLIAGWIDLHKSDKNIIISSDSDFFQLINKNVMIYDGIKGCTISVEGFKNDNGTNVINKKTKKSKLPVNPEWELFKKIMRGDATDGIFSAYPKIRETKLLEAFNDKEEKGYIWNNMMLQTWVDHNDIVHTVLNDYNKNKELIDLHAQPNEIKELIKTTINNSIKKKLVKQVGINLLRFCNIYQLNNISKYVEGFAEILQAPYNKK